jgi:hypothetical protein
MFHEIEERASPDVDVSTAGRAPVMEQDQLEVALSVEGSIASRACGEEFDSPPINVDGGVAALDDDARAPENQKLAGNFSLADGEGVVRSSTNAATTDAPEKTLI